MISEEDWYRIIRAASAWAWRKKYRVKSEKIHIPGGMAARITLLSKVRKRKDEDLYKYL